VIASDRLGELAERGWRLTRDGSTATAFLAWDDPEEPECGWELMVLHTAGHGARFVLTESGGALSERSLEDARRLEAGLKEAVELLEAWDGEVPDDWGLGS